MRAFCRRVRAEAGEPIYVAPRGSDLVRFNATGAVCGVILIWKKEKV